MASATAAPREAAPRNRLALAWLLLIAAVVAVSLGIYGREHTPAARPLPTLGFSSMLPMKAWLTTIALGFVFVQLVTALWMWGRLPGHPRCPGWVVPVHRWSGTTAFIVTLPVAFHCLWSLGFETSNWRVVAHGTVGCLFYGAYAAKMLALRLPGLPGWTLPVVGGSVLASVALLWLTAALWFFTRSGLPLT